MLALLFFVRGTNVVGVKLAQKDRVSTIPESVIFVTIYSALQAILILFAPPYQIFIADFRFYIWPFCYAIFYFAGNVLLLKSLRLGSASIANTIGSFNSLVVVVFSMIYWNEKLSVFELIGLALFIIGLFVYNGSSFSVGEQKQKVSVKFLCYALGSMLLTGTSVIFTKLGMQAYPDYGKQYLFYYALFAALIGAVMIAFSARKEFPRFIRDKKFLAFAALAALAVDTSNTLFVSYINAFPTAIFIPSFSVIGMLGIILASRLVLKERISKSAMISSVICMIAILFLNLS